MKLLKLLSVLFIASVLVVTRPDRAIQKLLHQPTSMENASKHVKDHWRQIVKITSPSNDKSGGTGFAIKAPSGKTVTISNAHVCAVAEDGRVAARWDNGRYTILNILEVDKKQDLCLMEGLPGGIEGLDLGWTEANINDFIYTIGHPLLYPNTYSEGLVRSREKMFVSIAIGISQEKCEENGYIYREYPDLFGLPMGVCGEEPDAFGTSVRIFPGNSGSPVFNVRGEVIGVMFAGDGTTNDGSYIPLEYLERILASY